MKLDGSRNAHPASGFLAYASHGVRPDKSGDCRTFFPSLLLLIRIVLTKWPTTTTPALGGVFTTAARCQSPSNKAKEPDSHDRNNNDQNHQVEPAQAAHNHKLPKL